MEWGGTKSYDGGKAWSSVNHSTLSELEAAKKGGGCILFRERVREEENQISNEMEGFGRRRGSKEEWMWKKIGRFGKSNDG